MSAHHWVGLGSAEMTEPQAAGWTQARARAVITPLDLNVQQVICLDCGAAPEAVGSECPGPGGDLAGHVWVALMTLELEEDEVVAWLTKARPNAMRIPQALTVICRVCGQNADVADPTCPERNLADEGPPTP